MSDPTPRECGPAFPPRPLSSEVERLRRAAWAFTTRRVSPDAAYGIFRDARGPGAGDLVLARVDALGHHRGLQLSGGRRKTLFVGDEIVVGYGNRYAPNQFEAVIPKTLGPCHLVAGGGVAGKVLSWHSRIARGPTEITPLGLLVDAQGRRINLRDHALESVRRVATPYPTSVAVVGTAMDSGKTESAAYLVKGLTLAGVRVGYAKVTGTGAGGDLWLLKDAGADPVVDFTDAGLVSTYRVAPRELERVLSTLIACLGKSGVDAIVLEVADGILQPETAALLASRAFKRLVGGILFAAHDAMGALAGSRWLKGRRLPVVGISGVLTSSPLQRQEASLATGLPVFSRQRLARPGTAMRILSGVVDQPIQKGARGNGSRKLVAAEAAGAAPRPAEQPQSGIPRIRP